MAQDEYIVTEMFEQKVAQYTGAPYAVAVDSCSSAIFLGLVYYGVRELEVSIPSHTYMSVPCMIRFAGGLVRFVQGKAEGAYRLFPTKIYDSALRFTANMYKPETFMCLSFTGAHKHLKLGKGGMILTDDSSAYKWFKRARNSGRNEVNYSEDKFTMLGWNMYLLPELAARGLMLMRGFYKDGIPLEMKDVKVCYPDLSKFRIYTDEKYSHIPSRY